MAEGGLLQETVSTTEYTRRDTVDSHLLECAICLEQLRRPKSLPCLHTFCQECLATYITKDLSGEMASAASFPCPVCRKLTQPVNPSEGIENWAQQFPTNRLIQEPLVKMKTDKLSHCKPCERKGNMETPATIWCKTCKVLFCDSCKENLHDLVHEECETEIISNPYGFVPREKSILRCVNHSQKMKYYCEDHQVFCCPICITVDHRRCGVVTTAQEYCDTLKDNSKWDEWTESLRKATDALELLITEFSEEINTKAKQQDIGFTSIMELRERVDTCLNSMQKQLTDELVSAIKADKENLEIAMQKCERLMSSIQNTSESSEVAIQNNDYIKSVQLYQRGQAEVESCKDMLREMKASLLTVSVQHVVDPSLSTPAKDVPLSLGKIVVQKQPVHLSDGAEQLAKRLSECRAKEISKFSIKRPSDSSDCCAAGVVYMPNSSIVLGDNHNQKLKLFSDKGEYLDEMTVPGNPSDLCLMDSTTVAVAVIDPPSVHVVRVMSSQLSPSLVIPLPGDEECWGIAYLDGEFIVGTRNIGKVSKSGRIDELYSCEACNNLAQDQIQGYIFGTNNTSTAGDITVFRLTGPSNTDILKVGVIKGAVGIDVDRDGNVYVCGRTSNNVVQMAGDGNNVRELLTSADGVDMPRAISVRGDKFVVTNDASEHKNEVRVFQLC